MLLSVFTYAFVFGWSYAVGFVALLLTHEMGHFLAARRRGLKVGLPTFIPFVGHGLEAVVRRHSRAKCADLDLRGASVTRGLRAASARGGMRRAAAAAR